MPKRIDKVLFTKWKKWAAAVAQRKSNEKINDNQKNRRLGGETFLGIHQKTDFKNTYLCM
jgi:hypothetical protein